MFLQCFGNISYWKILVNNPHTSFQVNHSFQKQSMLSQYQIIGPNGILKCSVPIQKSSKKSGYQNVLINYTENWQEEQWKSIQNAYKKSPYFQYYDYKIEPIFKTRKEHLLDYNLSLIKVISQSIHADLTFNVEDKTEVYYSDNDLRLIPAYPQVFDSKLGFIGNMSVLDLLFNLGPESLDYLVSDISS